MEITMEKNNVEKCIMVYNNSTKIADIMEPLLAAEGIGVVAADSEIDLFAKLRSQNIHLLLIDIELDNKGLGSDIKLLADIRRRNRIPVIVVSRQCAEAAKISALNTGADDYVTLDCNPLELLARIKSQLRRYTELVGMCANIDGIYRVDGLEINDMQRKVTVDGREVKLTPIEYQILRLLTKERGRVMSISQIYENIWHMQAIGADNTIAVHIRHIREKIESNPADPRYLKVVWGTGYKVG